MGLESCDLAEKEEDAAPFRPLPCNVCANEEDISSDCAKTTESGDETELADLFT